MEAEDIVEINYQATGSEDELRRLSVRHNDF
jgi:hypothetical protein